MSARLCYHIRSNPQRPAGLNCSLSQLWLRQICRSCRGQSRVFAECEQSGTEWRIASCHDQVSGDLIAETLGHPVRLAPTERSSGLVEREEGESMAPVSRPLRRRLTSIADLFGKLRAILIPRTREVRSQRMCPFCGLITPRHKAACLECGKSLSPA